MQHCTIAEDVLLLSMASYSLYEFGSRYSQPNSRKSIGSISNFEELLHEYVSTGAIYKYNELDAFKTKKIIKNIIGNQKNATESSYD